MLVNGLHPGGYMKLIMLVVIITLLMWPSSKFLFTLYGHRFDYISWEFGPYKAKTSRDSMWFWIPLPWSFMLLEEWRWQRSCREALENRTGTQIESVPSDHAR